MPPTDQTKTTNVAVILKGYPRLSETFIAEEIHALQQAGVALTLFSLRHPTDPEIHPVHRAIHAPVVYLPEYLYREWLRVLRAWWRVRGSENYRHARQVWSRDWRRDKTANRIRRFGQALVLAAELPTQVELLYAHFLHTPASVARYAAIIRALPWSCSAHAKDIWTLPDWEMQEKLAACKWLTTCTRANLTHLQSRADDPEKVALNYHGLALSRFPNESPTASNRDGNDVSKPVRILSVGRAVAKKNYHELLDALAALPENLHWQLTHIGAGPLIKSCQQHAAKLGIDARINWLGAQSQQAVIAQYRAADLFVLNCQIAADGDRDGLPNVIVEAQSQALAVLSTDISGVPELIANESNGILVPANNPAALATALTRLISDPKLRHQLGTEGKKIVHERFDMQQNFQRLLSMIVGEN